jgi:hypothetical protein
MKLSMETDHKYSYYSPLGHKAMWYGTKIPTLQWNLLPTSSVLKYTKLGKWMTTKGGGKKENKLVRDDMSMQSEP